MTNSTCFLVLGMHRSGTSALTRSLSLAGAALPKVLIENKSDNITGHWESQALANFHDSFLSRLSRKWDDFRELSYTPEDATWYHKEFEKILSTDYRSENPLIVIKEPRMSRFSNLTIKCLEDLKYHVCVIHALRHPMEVANSLFTRNDMPISLGLLDWARYVLDIELSLKDRPHSIIEYNTLINRPAETINNLFKRVDIPPPPPSFAEEVSRFIRPDLRHHKSTNWIKNSDIRDYIEKIYDLVSLNAPYPPTSNFIKELFDIEKNLNRAIPTLHAIREINCGIEEDQQTPINTAIGLSLDIHNNYAALLKKEATLKTALNTTKNPSTSTEKEIRNVKLQLNALRNLSQNEELIRMKLSRQLEAEKNRVKILDDQCGLERGKNKALRGHITRKTKLTKTLQEEVTLKDNHLKIAKKSLQDLSQQIDSLVSLSDSQAEQINIFKTEISEKDSFLMKSLQDLSQQIDSLVSLSNSQAERIKAFETEISEKDAFLVSHQLQIQALKNSTSWKLMQPLRTLVNIWRNRSNIVFSLIAGSNFNEIIRNENISAAKSPATERARYDLDIKEVSIFSNQWMYSRKKPLNNSDLPKITISAVTYNSEIWLSNFFSSIELLDYPMQNISIHFVDNGSSDQTVQCIENFIARNKHRYGHLQITERPNLGYGAGNDWAIRVSEDDYVLVTNVDAEFYPCALRECVSFALADKEHVACWEFRQTPYEHPKYYDPVTLLTNWNSHACVLIRRCAYIEVGGYDKKIFMYGEDVELSYRFRAAGWLLRYVPYAVIKHHVDLEDLSKRPNQLSGSIAANILLRYRYGSLNDIAGGEALLANVQRHEHDLTRIEAFKKSQDIIRKEKKHFWKNRISKTIKGPVKAYFPFNEFDYDIARAGADVICKPYKRAELHNLPLISVITRTYGPSDHHLKRAIASVQNQTYTNIEHIIVEDQTDFGRDITEMARDIFGHDRIQYFKSPGIGRSECGNYGASKAKGKYLCWLDNDDLLFADHIETLVRNLDVNPDAIASYALAWEGQSHVSNGNPEITRFELASVHAQPYDRERLLIENFIPIQAIIFRRDIFNSFGGFNPKLSQLEDWNLWVRYSCLGDFLYTPKITSIFRTPSDIEQRKNRHSLLHDAYADVSQRNLEDIKEVKSKMKQMGVT